MDHNGFHHRTQGVCGHVHVRLFAGQVFFHYAVTLGQHIFFVEGLGAFVGITVHADILQAGCRVVAGPEEIIAFLVALKFLGSKELALEHLPSQVVCGLGVFLLELFDEAVHLGLGEKVYNVLTVLGAELFQFIFRGAVDCQHNLVQRILVAYELHSGLRILCRVNVYPDDVAEDVERAVEIFLFHL